MTEEMKDVPEADPNDFSELEEPVARGESDADMPPPAAKISAADPSLPIASSGRRLQKRAIALAVMSGVGVAAGTLLFSGKGQATTPTAAREESAVSAPVPQSLLDAPEHVERKPEPEAPAPAPLPAVPAREAPQSSTAKAQVGPKGKPDEELKKARTAGILVDIGLPATTALPPPPRFDEDRADERQEQGVRGSHASSGAAPGGGDVFQDPNLQGRKNQFLSGELDPSSNGLRLSRLRHPHSPYELKPGTIIPAAVESAISSDLPGPVIARVTENVCDSVNGDWLLVPQGATLIAYYDSMVAWGQERVLMCWKQLELPNGDEMSLGCMPAADWAGQAGMSDQVDEHWWRIIKGAAVSSLLTAATAAAAGNTVGYNPTLPQLAARGAATEIGTVGTTLTRRNIMIQPTLTIRQAQPVNVIITETLDFSSDAPPTPCHAVRLP